MTSGPGKIDTALKTGGKSVFNGIVLLLVCLMLVSCSGKENVTQSVINEQSVDLPDKRTENGLTSMQGTPADTAVEASNTSSDIEVQDSNMSPAADNVDNVDTVITAAAALKLAEEVTDRQNDRVIQAPADYNNAKMPLLAALPSKAAYLYGVKEGTGGVVLYIGDKAQYFDWPYLTPRFILPEMRSCDYDKDGRDELTIDLYWGSGTGVSLEALHIIEISADNSFTDNVFDDYTSQLGKSVSFKTFVKSGELMGRITIKGKNYDVSLKDYQSEEYGKINDDLVLDSIVRFNLNENRITAEFGVGITSDVIAWPSYIGTVYCGVSYSDGGFELKDIRFEANQV